MKDPYVYQGTETLVNLFNERNEDRLREIEANYTSLRLRQLVENPLQGHFSFSHLCKMHHFIFRDLYKWAGKPRTVNIEKAEAVLGGFSVQYSDTKNIKSEAVEVLKSFKNINWTSGKIETTSKNFSKHMATLWKIHPFREGNTRTIINFCCDMAEFYGHAINRELFEQNSLYVRNALVAASAVFDDLGDKSNPKYLQRIVLDALSGE